MKFSNFISFSLIWVLFLFKLGFGVQLGQQALAEHRRRLTLSNKVFENYGDMPFYPGYRPIKSRFRFILPRFKEIRSEIRENSTFSSKNTSFLFFEPKNNENMPFPDKNDKNTGLLKQKTVNFTREPIKSNENLTEKQQNSSKNPQNPQNSSKKSLFFREISEEMTEGASGGTMWSSLGNILTFNEIKGKINEINDYYQKYVKAFSSEIQSNRELKNLVIFSLGIIALIGVIVFRNCCLEPINTKISGFLSQNTEKNPEKFLLQGRKILRNGGKELNAENYAKRNNESGEMSNSSENNEISKVLKELNLPEEREKPFKFGAIFNNTENFNRKAGFQPPCPLSLPNPEEEESINIDIETFINELDEKNTENTQKNTENTQKNTENTQKNKENPENPQKNNEIIDFEAQKKARRLTFLVSNHLVEETLITKCLNSKH